jgi:hypothetical protein
MLGGTLPPVSDDQLEFGSDSWYPVGEYEMVIQTVYENPLGQTSDGKPFNGYQTTDGEQISLQVGDFTPLNGSVSAPGNNKAFIKICLRDGDMDITQVDPSDRTYRQLAQGLRKIHALANALGEDASVEFVKALAEGHFNGTKVGASWQKWSNNGKSGSFVKKFFALR